MVLLVLSDPVVKYQWQKDRSGSFRIAMFVWICFTKQQEDITEIFSKLYPTHPGHHQKCKGNSVLGVDFS